MFARKDLLSMMDLPDLHTYATASDHAYNSPYEMVHSTSAKELSLFGCSDHAPTMPGSYHSFHFINFKALPRTLYDVRLMMGVELNITDYDGTISLEQSVLKPLDYTIVSLHQPCIHSGATFQNTNAYLGAPKSSLIHIIGHPDGSRFPIDYDTLVAAAKERHKLLKVNDSSLNPLSFRVGTRNNYMKMLELCRRCGTSIIINSNAHCEADAGNHTLAYAFLKEVNFPRELIVSTSLDRLCYFLPEATAVPAQREDERYGHLYRPITMEEGNAPGGNESWLVS